MCRCAGVLVLMCLLYILFIFLSISVKAQSTKDIILEVGTELPLNYSIGFGYNYIEDLHLSFRAGILTRPYDLLILEILEFTGTEESLVNTVRDAFTHRLMAKGGIKELICKNPQTINGTI